MHSSITFSKLKKILSGNKTGIVIILFSMLARIFLQLYFFNISGDRSFQLVAVKSFFEGHGFSILQVLPHNIDKQIYSPVVGWPPGYSIFLLPFYFVCGKNVITAAIFFEVISSIAFIVITRRLLQLLNVQAWLVNISTLISGFFIYDFTTASSSDFCTLILFLFSIYCTLIFLKKEKSPAFGFVIAVMLFSCALTRYMYVPIVLPLALYLLYLGYLQKDKRIIKGGLYCVILLTLLLGFLFFYQKQVTGSATYIMATKKGFFPANLLQTNSILFTPFVDIQFLCSSLSIIFNWNYVKQVEIIQLVHLLPYTIVLVYSVIFLIKKMKPKKSLRDHFVYSGVLCSLSIVALLGFLSLTNKSIDYNFWTFVHEPRYYAFIVVFIHQLLFIYLFNERIKINDSYKTFKIIVIVLLSLQVLHGFYFVSSKLISERNNFTVHKEFSEAEQFFYTSLDSLKKMHPNKEVIVTSSNSTFQNLAVLKGYRGMYQAKAINNPSSLSPFKNKVFLVVLKGETLPEYKKFLQLAAIKQAGRVGWYYFYVLEI